MALSFVGSSTAGVPGGGADGDLYVVYLIGYFNLTTPPSLASPWVHVGTITREEGGDDDIIAVYKATRAGSDPSISGVNWGTTGSNGSCCQLWHDPDGPPDVSAFATATGSANPLTLVPSVAVLSGGATSLCAANFNATTWTNPTSYTSVTAPFTEAYCGYRLSAPDPSAPSLVSSGNDHGVAIILAISPGATGLVLASSSPSDNATAAPVDGNITITYSAAISDGGAGAYELRKTSDNSLVESFSSGQFSIASATVTLNPSTDLLPATGYYIEADAGVVERTSDADPSPAISGATALNFTTAAAVEYVEAGAFAYSGTNPAPAYPTGFGAYTTQDIVILLLGQKPSTANSGSVTTPSGFTLLESLTGAGGYGATLAADTGNTNLYAYYRECDGSESGTVTVTTSTSNSVWARIIRIRKAGTNWTISWGSTDGEDSSAGNVSITGAANPGITLDDLLVWAMCIPTDVTTPSQFSAHALTATSATIGTAVEVGEADSGTGNDIGGFIAYATCTAGTATAAPVFTATAGGTTTNVRGPGVILRVRATAPGGISGTLSKTLDAATVSAAGALTISGAASPTLGAVTLSSASALAIVGTSAPTLAPAALSATGVGSSEITAALAVTLGAVNLAADADLAITGAASFTLGVATLTSVGSLSVAGALTASLAPLTVTSAARLDIVATATPTLGAATLVASSELDIAGSLSVTLGSVTLAATGSLGAQTFGALAVTLEDATVVSSGELDIVGQAAATLGAASVSSAATLEIRGQASVALAAATLSSASQARISGQASATLGDVSLAASGALGAQSFGAMSVTLGDMTAAAVGALKVAASCAVTLAPVSATASGELDVSGSLAATLQPATLSATGSGPAAISGQAAIQLSDATVAAQSVVALRGQLAAALGDVTSAAEAKLAILGSASIVLGAVTLTAQAGEGVLFHEAPPQRVYQIFSEPRLFYADRQNRTFEA